MTDIENILYKLGSIETDMADIKSAISKLPCRENTEDIIRLQQSAQNNSDTKSNKYKLNAQIFSIIALSISTLVAISSLYASFVK